MKIIAIATMLAISTAAFAAPPAPTNKQSDASQGVHPTLDPYDMVYRLRDRNQDPSGNRIPLPKTQQDPYGVQRHDPYDGQRPLQSVPAPAGKAGPEIG